MAWLGVNLNESLSSIKGQISSFTREVLAEDGVDDHGDDIVIPRKHVKELESAVHFHKQEVEELKKSRREVEDMQRGAELSASKRISDLKQQLSETQKELQQLKEKSSEWHWDNVNSRNHLELLADEPEECYSQHKNQISSLERQLKEESQKHENEIIAIQEVHKAEIKRIEKEFAEREFHATEANEFFTTSDGENQKQLELHQEAKISELRMQLASLTSSYKAVCEERTQFNSSLVELDNEHQQVIDQVLKSKMKVSEELLTTKKSLIAAQTDLTRNNDLLSISQTKVSELLRHKKDMASQVTLIQKKYEDIVEEKNRLLCEINQIKDGIASGSSYETNHLFPRIKQLEDDVQSRENTIFNMQSELCNNESLISQLGNEILNLSQKLEHSSQNELSKTSFLESEVIKLQSNLEDERKENETLRLKLSLQFDDSKRQIDELNDKVNFYKIEVLKYEAVLEEKNNEFVNAYDRLQHQEEVNKNIMHEFDTERREISLKLKDAEDKQKYLVELSKKCDDKEDSSLLLIMDDLLKFCGVETVNALPSAVSELSSEVALLRCERDKLTEDLATITQELRDNQELLETQELEKSDIEHECEDLRDQIEELQCGERQNPEGSVTPRSLPTIEEEEDISTNLSENIENKGDVEGKSVVGNDCSEDFNKFELLERIEQLNTQVVALTEARLNLELELSSLRTDKSSLEQSLLQANGQLGNLANLEVEAVNLRTKNETLIDQLNETNIQLQSCSQIKDGKNNLSLQVQEMTEAMGKINVGHSKIHSSTESDEPLKGNDPNAWMSHFESESQLSLLQNELDKVKGLLIYKDDQIDQWKQGIEQIGELFGLENKDLRQTFVSIKQKYETLNSKVRTLTNELEKIKDTEGSSDDGESDSEDIMARKVQNLTESQGNLSKLNDDKISDLQRQLNENMTENTLLIKNLNVEKNKCSELEKELEVMTTKIKICMDEILDKTKVIEYLYLKESELKTQLGDNTKEKVDIESKLKKIQEEFEQMLIENQENITKLLRAEEDIVKIDNDCKQLHADNASAKLENLQLMETRQKFESERKIMEKEIEILKESVSTLKADYECISQQLSVLQHERQQMIATSTQKHQEAVSYYNEIQRLSQVIQMEKQNAMTREDSLKSQLNLKDEEIQQLHEEIKLLKTKIVKLQHQIERVKDIEHLQTSSKNEVKLLQEELRNVNDELSKQKELCKSILNEREQLRLVNDTFNFQYEDKAKELTELQEKEKYLSHECIRLKQHLMEVEETYTQEAVQSELRENSLRQSISKLHEKMSSHSNLYSTTKEKNNAQLESLQEKLRDAVYQRDEAVQKLQIAEEASLQHQEGLSRLQQVLQDFQKAQVRDIASATEREKRRYEEERKRNGELELEMRKLQEKLNEVESTLYATKSMREELQTKEDTIIALKSQVQAVQSAAKKSQEQVALLHSTSEGKVDKHLLRNLIVGYFATNSDKRSEVLHVVAQVLDFSAEERARTGIDVHSGSWLSSIANFLAPPPSNIRIASKVDVLDHTSLSQAFIRFLEEESSPRQYPRLPAVEMAEEAQMKAQKKINAKATYNTNPLFRNTEIPSSNTSASPFHVASLSTLQPVTTVSNSVESLSDKDDNTRLGHTSQPLPLQTNPLLLASNPSSFVSSISPVGHDTYFTVDEIGLSEPKFLSKLLNSEDNSNGQSKT